MKKVMCICAALLIAATAFANQVWTVEPGSYMSVNVTAITNLLHTRHGTAQYRHFRDVLIYNGLLQPVTAATVSVIATNGEVAEISGYRYSDGAFVAFYLPTEDLVTFLGGQDEPSQVGEFTPVQ